MNDIPILAQYTIRSKQDYIFRTNRLLEIVGASSIIAESFDLLFQCAKKECGLKTKRASGTFSMEETLSNFDDGTLDLVELFIGGGNETVLFKNMETCRAVNRKYTAKILKDYPGVLPMYVGVPMSGQNGYRDDYQKLMAASDREKNRMVSQRGRYALPFARTDRVTFQPISTTRTVGGEDRQLSDESDKKYQFGETDVKNTDESRMLDNLVTKKGDESLLAIVHADGNNMGKKIQIKLPKEKTDYDFCVNAMREFTNEIDTTFSKVGKKAVDDKLEEIRKRDEKMKSKAFARWIVCDGDDATFICNARLAKELAEAYLRGVSEYQAPSGEHYSYSSCAGICIFRSHYPFARAYHLAEQACESAKEPVHRTQLEQNWIDFHYIHSGVGGDLDDLRALHQTGALVARPWFVCGEENTESKEKSIGKLDALWQILNQYNIAHSNIKDLGTAYEESVEQGNQKWNLICYHAKAGLDAAAKAIGFDDKGLRKALYDLSEVFDLWYAGREEE